MMESVLDRIIALDKALFLAINGGWASPCLDIVMVFVTLFGNGLFLAGVVGPILYFGDRRHFVARISIIIAAVALGGLVNNVIKEAVGRPRPLAEFSEQIRTGGVWVHTVFEQWRNNSFPSGHSQTAFGTATAVTYYYRGWYTVPIFVLAAAVALSRIYLGVHFPLDVATGALVGICCSLAVCMIGQGAQDARARRRKQGGFPDQRRDAPDAT
jgi:undecaprenyl-diphosphatase